MGCCFCCLSEGEKVGKVLENFPGIPASQAQDGNLSMVVGHVVLAGTAPFYSPGGQRPCVYFYIEVEEEYVYYTEHTDQNGHRHQQRQTGWRDIFKGEQFCDFYLQDGVNKVFVQASQRSMCKIQSDVNASGGNWGGFGLGNIPPGVRALIYQNKSGYGWSMNDTTTGNYRYRERCFELMEKVGGLGVITPAQDPFTGQPVKFLKQFDGKCMPPERMAAWSDHARESWEEFSRTPVVLLTDSTKFTGVVQIQPVMNYMPPPCNWAMQYPGYNGPM